MIRTTTSFSNNVKEEIVSRDYSKERLLSILSSFTRINGTLSIEDKKEKILYRIENPKIAKFIFNTIQKLFKVTPTISYLKKNNFNKNTYYLISFMIPDIFNKIYIDILDNKIDNFFYKDSEKIGGYLAGSFLASGSVNSPRSSNYHLEISFLNFEYAKNFIKYLSKYKDALFNAKIIKRRDKYVFYIKRSDQIVDFLILMGATDNCLYFENTRVDRDYLNNVNRIQNLDISNYQKMSKVAKKDIDIINKLIAKKGLMNLGNEKTICLINARLNNPEASLKDLAKIMSDELHTEISKSNVNHILRGIRNEGRNL